MARESLGPIFVVSSPSRQLPAHERQQTLISPRSLHSLLQPGHLDTMLSSGEPCLSREVGLDDLQWSLPTGPIL